MDATRYPTLAGLNDPADIRRMRLPQLERLAEEARDFLIETIHKTGGHLGAALGVVELTVALFHHFDFLMDRVAWDVGHQAHVHKLLTGRGPRFSQYGLWGGLSKFLERSESPYDHVGAGHASTSISMALGMALARDIAGESHKVLAVIGDGAMTGGLAYEALSAAGGKNLDLVVILNDNGMSIDRNVGAIARAVTKITSSDSYNLFRDEVKSVSRKLPFGSKILKGFRHVERSVKDYVSPDVAAFFESLNFRYFGPINGHNLGELISMLGHAKAMEGPVLIHVSTVKGKGLGAELENTFEAHAVSAPASAGGGKKSAGEIAPAPQKSWTAVYTEGMTDLMAADPQVVAITAAMLSNTGLAPLKALYPERVLDMGIAEANAFCSAAGLAVGGIKPFVTVYSTFSQRAFDQLVHDIALQKLPVRIMMDRGGFVGNDGPTHHGVFDHSYLRLIPGFVHMAPRDELEMRRMILTAQQYSDGPIAMRYPRGNTEAMELPARLEPIPIGKGETLLSGPNGGLALIAVGSMVKTALEAAKELENDGIACSVIDARFIKPLDEELLLVELERAKAGVVLEENVLSGGMGEGVLHLMSRHGLLRPTRLLGAPDEFVQFGSQQDQLTAAGLTPPLVVETAHLLWGGLAGTSTRTRKKRA